VQQPKSLPTATSELHALLALPALASVPLLVLANKNDLPDAVGVDDLIREMRLGEIGGRLVSVSQLVMCQGIPRSSRVAPRLPMADCFHSATQQATRRSIISISYSHGSHNGHIELLAPIRQIGNEGGPEIGIDPAWPFVHKGRGRRLVQKRCSVLYNTMNSDGLSADPRRLDRLKDPIDTGGAI